MAAMASQFPLEGADVLSLSLAVNALLLLHVLVSRLLDLVTFLLRGRSRLVVWVTEIGRTRPGLVARLLSEQLSLWTLVAMVTCLLRDTDLASHPFRSASPPLHVLLRAVLAVSVGRSLLLACRLALTRDVHVVEDHAKTRVTVGHTGNTKADLFLAAVDAGSKIVCLSFKQNVFLVVTASFYELSSSILDMYRLMEVLGDGVSFRTLKRTAVFHLLVFVVCRVVLPVIFLSLALIQDTPFVMDTVPLVAFFFSGAIHLCFHCFWLYQIISLVLRPPPELLVRPRLHRTGQSGTGALDALSNDIPRDADSANDVPRTGFSLFKGSEYVFLRSYDNRNVSFIPNYEGSEKMNIFRRKDVPKNVLTYKRIEDTLPREKISPTENKSENNQSELTTEDTLLGSQSQTSPESGTYDTVIAMQVSDRHLPGTDETLDVLVIS